MRTIFMVSVTVLLLLGTSSAARAEGPNPAVAADPVVVSPDLRQALEEDLRARQPRELAFIEKVIDLIENGTLTESLVRSTYLWAKKKPRRKFQYFERGLRFRASRLGIDLQ